MRKDYMYFTNLGIVNCSEFEVTYSQFLKKMSRLISENNALYNVKYDEVNKKYVIVYNSHVYEVKTGKDGYYEKSDVIEILNELVKISEEVEKIKREELSKKKYDEHQRDIAFRNAVNGIIQTNGEKRAKIKLLNDEYNENDFNVFKRVGKIMKEISFKNIGAAPMIVRALVEFIIAIIVIPVIATAMGIGPGQGFLGILFLVTDFVIVADLGIIFVCYDNSNYQGIFGSLFAFLSSPFILGYNLVKKAFRAIKHGKEIKKLRSGIYGFDQNLAVLKHIGKEGLLSEESMEHSLNNMKKNSNKYSETIKSITSLRNRIMNIENDGIKKKFMFDLYEIIYNYMEVKQKDDSTSLTVQIVDLGKRVDEEIRKEQGKKTINEECDEYVENITRQKSIGTR